MDLVAHKVLRFDRFLLDLTRGCLRMGEQQIDLRPKAFQLLTYLAANAGRLVSKQELIEAVWPNVAVSDESLEQCIRQLRRGLGDADHRLIKTVPRRGYLFDVAVSSAGDTEMETSLARPPLDRPSIAVLPFTNLSGDREQEYFADGVVEDIITALSRIRWLFVIARNSSFTYKDKTVDVKEVGRELGVRYVLEGSIRKSSTCVRVTGQLIDSVSGAHIWADRFESNLEDIFALQDEIALAVVGAMEPQLRFAELERTRQKPTESLDAYDFYLRALPLLRPLERDNSAAAEKLLRKAIEIDSSYADALALLADVVVRRTVNTWIEDWAAGMAEARELAWRAVVADPGGGTALAAAAFTYVLGGFGLEEAKDFADRALASHPMSPIVQAYVGWTYMYLGESDTAISHLQVARRISPFDPHSYVITLVGMAGAHLYARRFGEAITAAKQALNVSPEHTGAGRYLAAALAHAGRVDEARAVVREMVRKNPLLTLERQRHQTLGHPWMLDLLTEGLRKAGLPQCPTPPVTVRAKQEVRYCCTRDGVRLGYAVAGSGPPLVKAGNWLHHLEYDWESPVWCHVLHGLAQDHTLIRYDTRGNGLSDWEVEELSLDVWVNDLETVVDAAGVERFPLLGISQGCAISVAYAVRHPERVSHLVLYGGYVLGAKKRTPGEKEKREAMLTLARLEWGSDNPAFRQLFTGNFMPDATPDQADFFNELQRRTTSPNCAARSMDATGDFDISKLLPKVRAPTLVMHVRGDLMVPLESGRALAAGIPGARFVSFPGRNHFFLEHEPASERFFEEVRGFLGR